MCKIIKELNYPLPGKYDWKSGRIVTGVYSGGDENHSALMVEMFRKTVWTNPLHADIFPGARKMEAEIIAIAKDLFHCTQGGVGCVSRKCKFYINLFVLQEGQKIK